MGDNYMWKCNIEELIKQSGFRKDYIANKIGTTTRQLRKYEKSELFIPMKNALLLAELLRCSIADFYERLPEKKDPYLEPIEELNLSVRVLQILQRNGIITIGELQKVDYFNFYGLGYRGFEEIQDKLRDFVKEYENERND